MEGAILKLQPPPGPQVDARTDILERRQQRKEEAAVKAPAKAAPEEPQELELDDLFRKTETLPALYWLPVAKKAAATADAAELANGKAAA